MAEEHEVEEGEIDMADEHEVEEGEIDMAEEHEVEEGEIDMADEHEVEEEEIDMAEEHEVEEGEIYDDLHIDIDVKIQSVLGDYMKDFEGAVSVENLGQKFGVYGSFLPIYQRPSTVVFQPTTPHKSQKLPSPSVFSSQESIIKHKVSINSTYQTTLKLHSRVRVGYDRAKVARKSSDLHTSCTDSVDVSSKLREIRGDSPTNILQTMTSFPIALLSPLPNKLLTLSKKSPDRQPTSGNKPPVSPFVIEGDWICCRECRKWRLLPYGTKPEQLSQSWLCSMLDWIPGMNNCDISEEETTRALHALYQSLIQSNFQNHGGKGSIDVKGHNGSEVSVKKRKLSDQDYLVTSQCNGNDLGESDANAFEREVSGGFKKQKKSKVKRESSTSKGEEKSRTREHQTKKHTVKHQSQAESSMNRMQVCKVPLKKALGYGMVARPYIAYW